MATGVTCPIKVLKAKDTMTPIETPLERVRVSKTSEGMTQDKGPQVAEKLTLKSQVLAMKPKHHISPRSLSSTKHKLTPVSSSIVDTRRIPEQQSRRNDEENTIDKITTNQRPPSTQTIHEQDTHELRHKSQYTRNGLVFERIVSVDANLCI